MYFPPEIWEHIFLYADAVTLTNLRIVCNCWDKIIDKILKTNNHWFKACKRDIPEHLWSTFCESLDPTKYYTEFHEKHDSQMWMALYKLWRTSKDIMRWNVDAECIEPLRSEDTTEHITCVETSGNTIAIGSSEGYIYFYDICRLHKGAFYVGDHIELIESIQFMRDETCTICICCSRNKHISRWDVKGKTLIDKTHGELIGTSYSYSYTILRDMIIIEGLIPRTVYKLDTTKVIAIGADNDQVHLYTQENLVHLELDCEMNNVYQKSSPSKLPNIGIRRFYVFKPNIVVCIAVNGYVGFLVDGKQWEMYNLFPILHANPTTVLVYGHTLIIGVDSGNTGLGNFYSQRLAPALAPTTRIATGERDARPGRGGVAFDCRLLRVKISEPCGNILYIERVEIAVLNVYSNTRVHVARSSPTTDSFMFFYRTQ